MTSEQIRQLQNELNQRGANLKVDGILGPLTTAAIAQSYSSAIAQHPNAVTYIQSGNTPEMIAYAGSTGDFAGLQNPITGKPFSDEDQRLAVEKATAAISPYYEAEKRFEEDTFKRNLEDQNRSYQEYLDNSASSFEEDKKALDQNAANQGVLFSGGRIEKEKNLKNMYERDQASKMANVGSNISSLANNFQYKYGDEAVKQPGLSNLYNLRTNTFNPNVARGGVGAGGISSMYNPTGKNFQGTAVNTAKANAQTRAASLLTNKANKILPYGYQNPL